MGNSIAFGKQQHSLMPREWKDVFRVKFRVFLVNVVILILTHSSSLLVKNKSNNLRLKTPVTSSGHESYNHYYKVIHILKYYCIIPRKRQIREKWGR